MGSSMAFPSNPITWVNISPHILLKKNCCDLNLSRKALHIYLPSFLDFPGLDFYFDLF